MAVAYYIDQLGASTLLELLKARLAGANINEVQKDLLCKRAVISAGQEVWASFDGPHRRPALSISTTASQAYTDISASKIRHVWVPKRGLWKTDGTEDEVVRYVAPLEWTARKAVARAESGATGAPKIFTLGCRTISTVVTQVIEWAPTPDAVYAYEGLIAHVDFPDITFGTTGAASTDSQVFAAVGKVFDAYWEAAAVYHLVRGGFFVHVSPEERRLIYLAYRDAKQEALQAANLIRQSGEPTETDAYDRVDNLISRQDDDWREF